MDLNGATLSDLMDSQNFADLKLGISIVSQLPIFAQCIHVPLIRTRSRAYTVNTLTWNEHFRLVFCMLHFAIFAVALEPPRFFDNAF